MWLRWPILRQTWAQNGYKDLKKELYDFHVNKAWFWHQEGAKIYQMQGNWCLRGVKITFYPIFSKIRNLDGSIRKSKEITFDDPDVLDPRLMAMNMQVNGFSIRLVNVYSPTNSNGSDSQKDAFYRMIKKACQKSLRHQKLVLVGDFNATTAISMKHCCFDGRQIIRRHHLQWQWK